MPGLFRSPGQAVTGLLAGLVTVLLLVTACATGTVQRSVVVPPSIPGAQFIGNASCYDCHTNYARSFQGNAHFRLHVDVEGKAGGTSCESCHGPGSLHAQAPRDRATLIINPRKDPQACFTCHEEIHLQFRLPEHHPVLEGAMNCVQCHNPHGRESFQPNGRGGLAMARLNEQCAGCHREQARGFVFEHEALREGCASCHDPHGSIHPKLLTDRDANLCLKCHAQIQAAPGELFIGRVNHQSLLSLGSCWSAGCHTAVHGSNFQPKLLY